MQHRLAPQSLGFFAAFLAHFEQRKDKREAKDSHCNFVKQHNQSVFVGISHQMRYGVL